MTDLQKRIVMGEGYHLELKKSVDKSFIEAVCAFANSSGGSIVLGVSDKGQVVGCDTGNAVRSQIQSTLRQIEPTLVVKVSVEGNLLVVDVPAGKEKPYGCSKGFFMRMITNPGGLPAELKPEEFGTRSVARNPVIASLLLRADYIEQVGTGINRIRYHVKASNNCTVDFSYAEFFSAAFRFKPESTENDDNGRLNGDNGRLNDDNGRLNGDNGRLDTLNKQIRQLVERELGERRGSHKTGGYWVVEHE